MLYLIIKYILSHNSDFFLAFVISYRAILQNKDINSELQEKNPDKSQFISGFFMLWWK